MNQDIGVKRGIKRITWPFPSRNTSARSKRRRSSTAQSVCVAQNGRAGPGQMVHSAPASSVACCCAKTRDACSPPARGRADRPVTTADADVGVDGWKLSGVSACSSIQVMAIYRRAVIPGPYCANWDGLAHERTRSTQSRAQLWIGRTTAVSGRPLCGCWHWGSFWPNTTRHPLLLVLLLGFGFASQPNISAMQRRRPLQPPVLPFGLACSRERNCGAGHGGRQPAAALVVQTTVPLMNRTALLLGRWLKLPKTPIIAVAGRRWVKWQIRGVSAANRRRCGDSLKVGRKIGVYSAGGWVTAMAH